MNGEMLEIDAGKDKFGMKLQIDERVQQYRDCTQLEWNINEANDISLRGTVFNSLTILGDVETGSRESAFNSPDVSCCLSEWEKIHGWVTI